jgi:hypothetical protein
MSQKSDISGYGSSYRSVMDMGPTANERGGQTTSTIRRWSSFKGFLGTTGGGMYKKLENVRHMWPQIQTQTRYGNGSWCI